MSKPAANPFFETDVSKFMDMSNMSKMMGDFKMPSFNMPAFNFEALMSAQRKNIEAATAVSQAAFESWQALARRQAEMMRQGIEEANGLMNAIMSCPTPEEKVLRQAEASKAAMEKCLANAKEIADTVSKCNARAMETVSNRMSEGLEELRGIMQNTKQSQAA